MNHKSFVPLIRIAMAGAVLVLAGGCASLLPKATKQPSFYSLDSSRDGIVAEAKTMPTTSRTPSNIAGTAPTLVVNPPRAAAGFDSQRIIYIREAHKLEYFSHSEWIDTPARMLAPLIVAAIEHGGTFRAVVPTPSAAAGDIKLDSEIIRLQHDFSGPQSRVRFTLRAYLVESSTRRVLAWREFDETVTATSQDPYGGVVAANRAVQNVMRGLAELSREAVVNWRPEK
jgi:cholesterol transport system auxiliary component